MASENPWTRQTKSALPRILAVISLLVVILMTRSAYAQQGYTPDSLFIVLFSNGDALVEYDIRVQDPLADEIPVDLFGNTTSGLIVTDFDDKIIQAKQGSRSNQIVITPAGARDIRISYSTSDLASKGFSREWTFSIDSPVTFFLKMPAETTILTLGENIPSIQRIGGTQDLLTFKPGKATITYIVGFLDDKDAANVAIRSAENAIDEVKRGNPGILLNQAQALLASAKEAYGAEQFVDAQRFATQAVDSVEATVEDFGDAITARTEARTRLTQAEAENRDTTGARALFEQSDRQFAAGEYAEAANSAEDAVRAIGGVQQNILPYGIGAAVAGGAAGAFYFMRRRQSPRQRAVLSNPNHVREDASEPVHWPEPAPSLPDAPAAPAQEPAARLAGIPESQVDRNLLGAIVHRIIEERPHLRQEDRDVLVFLAQSEGAAFESEVRSKFQLPKTTVWRLVKRLEREELVEIRKAGGQNLIKLRFEGRQP
jgi:hypothetical protein